MSLKLTIFLTVLTVFGFQSKAEINFDDVANAYITKCGGKAYSKCDGEIDGLTQKTLFSSAEMAALVSKKKVVLSFGADWCPSCRVIARDFAEDVTLKARLSKHYVYVTINTDLASAKELYTSLKIKFAGVPFMAVYDPAARKVDQSFYAFEKGDTTKLVTYLESLATTGVISDSAKVEDVRATLLNSPIQNVTVNPEASQFVPSTALQGDKRLEFIRWMRIGLMYHSSFYWINSVRAFNQALKLERNPVALAFLALAMGEVSRSYIQSGEVALLVNEAADLANQSWVDADDRAFVNYVQIVALNKSPGFCASGDMKGKSSFEVTRNVLSRHSFVKAVYLALLGYEGYQQEKIEEALRLEPLNPGAHHYLIHLNEGSGKIPAASLHAQNFVKASPSTSHAQHMYGHILPQVGRWQEAADVFMTAHKIHLQEFKNEGIEPHEDWHYAHNLDLLLSTLIYLDRIEEAAKLNDILCVDQKSNETCLTAIHVMVGTGSLAKAESLMDNRLKGYRNHPMFGALKIMIALARKDFATAEKIVASLKKTDDFADDSSVYARIAYEVILQKGSEADALKTLETKLKQPGFDSWSFNVYQSRALMRVLRDNGRTEFADKIKSLSVAAFENSRCKTEVCKSAQ